MEETSIVLKQKAIIEYTGLTEIASNVKKRIESAMAVLDLEDENSLQVIKATRADLNKELKDLQDSVKELEKETLAPWNEFKKAFKDLVETPFKENDIVLRDAKDNYENQKKDLIRQEVEKYFNERQMYAEYDFVTFEKANINITLTASKKSYKEIIDALFDKVEHDLKIIEIQPKERQESILKVYKETLDLSGSLLKVNEAFDLAVVKQTEKQTTSQKPKGKMEYKTIELFGYLEDINRVVQLARDLNLLDE